MRKYFKLKDIKKEQESRGVAKKSGKNSNSDVMEML